VRIFLSFNSRDTALAEAVRAGLSRIEPEAQIFFSLVSLGTGFWLPKLAEEIAQDMRRPIPARSTWHRAAAAI
jgi:hypothetical protein